MKHAGKGLLGTTLLMLAGCSGLESVTAPSLPLAPGDHLRVEHALNLPAQATRIYLQDGEAGTARDITVWEDHCSLLVLPARESDYRISAGTDLTVADIQRTSDFGVWGKGVMNYRTLVRFTSSAHPVQALECELWHYGYDPGAYISRDRLKAVLDSVITFGEGD